MSLLLDAIKKAEQRERNQPTETSADGSSGTGSEPQFADTATGDGLELSIDRELLDDSPDLIEVDTSAKSSPKPATADDVHGELELSLEADPPAALEVAGLDIEPTGDSSKNSSQKPVVQPGDATPAIPLPEVDQPQSVPGQQNPEPPGEPVPTVQYQRPDEVPEPKVVSATTPSRLEKQDDAATLLGVSHPPYSAKQKKLGLRNLAILLVVGLVGVAIFYYLASLGDPQPTHQQSLAMTSDGTDLKNFHSVNESASQTSSDSNQPIANAAVQTNQQSDSHSTDFTASEQSLNKLSGAVVAGEIGEPPPAADQAVAAQFDLGTRNDPNNPNDRIDPGFIQPQASQNLIIRRTLATKHAPARQAAQAALLTGDLAGAERLYRQWQQQQPQSIHARFGLAQVATMRGDTGAASALYLEILQLDPENPAAQASLFNLPGLTSKESLRRLQTLLTEYPDDGYLNYVMGNHQARAGRWKQAQKYYFNAYSAQHDNAVYAFNLAIALDQLNQANAAAGYYRRALEITGIPLSEEARQQSQDRLAQLAAATANQQ